MRCSPEEILFESANELLRAFEIANSQESFDKIPDCEEMLFDLECKLLEEHGDFIKIYALTLPNISDLAIGYICFKKTGKEIKRVVIKY
jgi:hypothetical protein